MDKLTNDFYRNKEHDPHFTEYLTFDQAMLVQRQKEKRVKPQPRIRLPEFARKLLRIKI